MNKYEVEINVIETYMVKVEADTEQQASEKAELILDRAVFKEEYHSDSDRKIFVSEI